MTNFYRVILGVAALMVIAPAFAQEVADPATPEILSMRERAAVRDAWLTERLNTVIPEVMRREGADMWVLIAREYNEDPVVTTMLPATWLRARRRTVLVFFDPGEGPVERLAVSRYPVGAAFPAAWAPEEQPDQWARLAEIVAERDPKRITVNVSEEFGLADGTSHQQYEEFIAALPRKYRSRVDGSEDLAIGWLETRIPAEMEVYPSIVRIAHSILAEALSEKVITPGETTTDDVSWWLRERVRDLNLITWFHPSVSVARQANDDASVSMAALKEDKVIRPGDLLHVDFGITYLGLNTDTQHHAYVLKEGETDAPQGLKDGLAAANQVQDFLTESYEAGASSNEILVAARAKSIAAGLRPSIYSHPLGFHGHGAGSPIGWWDNQGPDHPKGYRALQPDTAWSIELNATHSVPEWGGEDVMFKLEEDAFFDGKTVKYLDGRQTELYLIPRQ
ncbi:MAG: M24 family metallopeptidase [Pseudomonadota bacterium]